MNYQHTNIRPQRGEHDVGSGRPLFDSAPTYEQDYEQKYNDEYFDGESYGTGPPVAGYLPVRSAMVNADRSPNYIIHPSTHSYSNLEGSAHPHLSSLPDTTTATPCRPSCQHGFCGAKYHSESLQKSELNKPFQPKSPPVAVGPNSVGLISSNVQRNGTYNPGGLNVTSNPMIHPGDYHTGNYHGGSY